MASCYKNAIPIAIIIELWLGAMFAWCAAARIRADGPWAQPAISLVALFAGIVLAPMTAYGYLAHPDWAWLYLVDPRRVPRLFVIPAVAAAAAALIGGYHGMARLITARVRRRHVLAALVGPGVLAFMLLLIMRGRVLSYGSYEAFHKGRAASLFQVKLGFVLVALVVGLTVAAVYVAWELRRDGRKAPAPR